MTEPVGLELGLELGLGDGVRVAEGVAGVVVEVGV